MRFRFLLFAFLVCSLVAKSAFAQSRSLLPHVANGMFAGGSFRTTFVVVNNTDSTANAVLSLTKDNGDPLNVTIQGFGTQSTFTLTLAPGATRILQSDGSGNLVTGAAIVTSSFPLGASAVFTVLDPQGNFLSEAGVGNSPEMSEFTLSVDETGTFNTGIAFYNPSTSAVTMNLRLLDANGAVARTNELTLPPKNHTARFASELFQRVKDFRGSIAVTGTGGVAAMALRQNTRAGTPHYTTLPVTAGASKGTIPASGSAPLLPKTVTGVSATSDVTLNATLPAGFKLTGTVSGGGYTRFVYAQSGEDVYEGLVDVETRNYLVVVPPGTYTLTIRPIIYGYQVPGAYWEDRVEGTVNAGQVRVSGDTRKDITLPAVSLFSISGTVAGLDTLPAPASSEDYIYFSSTDNTFGANFYLNVANGTWQGKLPSGTFSAGIYVVSESQNQVQEIWLSNLGTLSVNAGSATGSFTVPPTAQISGNVRGAARYVTASVICPPGPLRTRCGSTLTEPNATGNYQMAVAKNRTYRLGVWVVSNMQEGIFFSPPGGSALDVVGNTTFDVITPGLPGRVTLSGRVTDLSGHPVANTSVSVTSDSITGAPGVSFMTYANTDSSGNYSISVLSGTNYRVVFTPE